MQLEAVTSLIIRDNVYGRICFVKVLKATSPWLKPSLYPGGCMNSALSQFGGAQVGSGR